MGNENHFFAEPGNAFPFVNNLLNTLRKHFPGVTITVGPVVTDGVNGKFEDFPKLPPILFFQRLEKFPIVIKDAVKPVADRIGVIHFKEALKEIAVADEHALTMRTIGAAEVLDHERRAAGIPAHIGQAVGAVASSVGSGNAETRAHNARNKHEGDGLALNLDFVVEIGREIGNDLIYFVPLHFSNVGHKSKQSVRRGVNVITGVQWRSKGAINLLQEL